jgi:hypothetical protein
MLNSGVVETPVGITDVEVEERDAIIIGDASCHKMVLPRRSIDSNDVRPKVRRGWSHTESSRPLLAWIKSHQVFLQAVVVWLALCLPGNIVTLVLYQRVNNDSSTANEVCLSDLSVIMASAIDCNLQDSVANSTTLSVVGLELCQLMPLSCLLSTNDTEISSACWNQVTTSAVLKGAITSLYCPHALNESCLNAILISSSIADECTTKLNAVSSCLIPCTRAFRTSESESESADFSEVRVQKFWTLKTPFRTRTWIFCVLKNLQ